MSTLYANSAEIKLMTYSLMFAQKIGFDIPRNFFLGGQFVKDVKPYFLSNMKNIIFQNAIQASILYKSIAGRYRPVSYPDGPITARYRFIKNAYWDHAKR